MKKFRNLLSVSLIFTLIFSSCGKENLSDNSNQDSAKEVITVTASLPQIGDLNKSDNVKSIDTRANLEDQGNNKDVFVLWEKNDPISVFVQGSSKSNQFTLAEGVGKKDGKFRGEVTIESNPATALYPYSENATYNGETKTLTNLVLPNKYTDKERVAIPMFAFLDQTTQGASTSEAIDFPFKALGGFIHLTLKNIPEGVNAKYLKLTLLNGSNLSGTYNINDLSKACDTEGKFGLNNFKVEKTSDSPDDKKVIVPISKNNTVDIPVIGTNFKFGTFTLVLQDENNNDILSTFMKTKEFNKEIVPSIYLNVNVDFEKTSDYIDLSIHKDNYQETANCYIVNHVGKYKLPLVYGNAIKGGVTNPDFTNFTLTLPRYDGNSIKQPYIYNEVTPANCTVVWQDVKDLVTGVQLSSDKKFLELIVTDDKVEGNAIVAVKDSKGTIMWSWHIWLTNYKLGEGDIRLTHVDKGKTIISDIMPVNLGWCNTEDGGRNTYYQWGRKDPMLPTLDAPVDGKGNANADHAQFGPDKLKYKYNNPGTTISINETIKNPNIFYLVREWGQSYYYLWNYNTVNKMEQKPVSKTIYDPCPVGYHVADYNAFDAILLTKEFKSNLVKNKYINNFPCAILKADNNLANKDLVFPYTGYRSNKDLYDGQAYYVGFMNGENIDGKSACYLWSAYRASSELTRYWTTSHYRITKNINLPNVFVNTCLPGQAYPVRPVKDEN